MIKEILEEVRDRQRHIVTAIRVPKEEGAGTSVFMGIGVAQRKGTISPGLGLGTIGMAVTAVETARSARDRRAPSTINVLVADCHAKRFAHDSWQEEDITRSTDDVTGVLQQLFHALGERVNVIRSSDPKQWSMSSRQTYPEIETDDIVQAHTVLHAGIKVGWQYRKISIAGSHRWDERDFDRFAVKANADIKRNMGFIRAGEGLKTEKDNDGRHKVIPPYIGSADFALGQNIPDVRRRLKELGVKSDFHNWLVNLGNAITRLDRNSPKRVDPFEQIQRVIDKCSK